MEIDDGDLNLSERGVGQIKMSMKHELAGVSAWSMHMRA